MADLIIEDSRSQNDGLPKVTETREQTNIKQTIPGSTVLNPIAEMDAETDRGTIISAVSPVANV